MDPTAWGLVERPVVGGVERRDTIRRRTPGEHGIVVARVRPGHEAEVLDVSAVGMLLETAHRLLPGTVIDLHLETRDCRTAMRGRVLRCVVASIVATRVWYRGAIRFDRPLTWFADEARTVDARPDASGLSFSETRADTTRAGHEVRPVHEDKSENV